VSFRGRLTLFFMLIVVLPMVAVAVLVVNVTGESRNGKADARLAAGLEAAGELYQDATDRAERVAGGIARDPQLVAAMRAGDRRRVRAEVRRLARAEDVETLEVTDPDGQPLASIGRGIPIAVFEFRPEVNGRALGSVRASVTSTRAVSPPSAGRAGLTPRPWTRRAWAGPHAPSRPTSTSATRTCERDRRRWTMPRACG
jgi:hypothetical protein